MRHPFLLFYFCDHFSFHVTFRETNDRFGEHLVKKELSFCHELQHLISHDGQGVRPGYPY
ncbi:hypothetical protein GA0061096_3532 [Fictibacillus enclensis]|uniref:hypothetical protein n=1 Tax=Fictibacillus enclensis TaxID=1017270 RepID=UPI000815D05A|nr:hypothetical protein [Fictibacillus enclensis]SCC28170.1 hypothetical protein GA0061096_3532 [Fictibacillus enclensis]